MKEHEFINIPQKSSPFIFEPSEGKRHCHPPSSKPFKEHEFINIEQNSSTFIPKPSKGKRHCHLASSGTMNNPFISELQIDVAKMSTDISSLRSNFSKLNVDVLNILEKFSIILGKKLMSLRGEIIIDFWKAQGTTTLIDEM